MANNGSPVEAVSKVILEVVTSKKPNFRYLAGKNAETWAANKKTMSDIEFHNSIKNFCTMMPTRYCSLGASTILKCFYREKYLDSKIYFLDALLLEL
jgi:hypothetical protein